ncbi:hypothetical protein [Paenochrobactrum glaciei]|uniref:Uncharacterized protein n=1 Tax=Paenochrobactrum glaciei TaxID=486407 RepID=A0ABN1G3W8_9HYPH
MKTNISINDIIKKAGGAASIALMSKGAVKKDAVYKWPSIGIPDRHWAPIIKATGLQAADLYQANLNARKTKKGRAA